MFALAKAVIFFSSDASPIGDTKATWRPTWGILASPPGPPLLPLCDSPNSWGAPRVVHHFQNF
eukprot:1139814-Pelagomonas_calceolata.AAC.1